MRRLVPLLLILGAWAPQAPAAEYRLQVSSLHERSFAHFLDGRIGRGAGELQMVRLERALEAGGVPAGALIYGRTFQPARDGELAGFPRVVRVRAEVRAAENGRRWDEVVWDGKPGERSLWVIGGTQRHYQEVVHVAVGGRGPLRYWMPYRLVPGGTPAPALSLPLGFLQFYAERGTIWERYLGRAVSLAEGVAVLVGISDNPTFADWVYILVEHPADPATFKVVVGWENRRSTHASDNESPGLRE